MTHFDVFNGDADGICALHQLRLAAPKDSILISGVKRDIGLLQRVDAREGDSVTALDISLDVNRAALAALLGRGVRVEYFDHHFAGVLPAHPNLTAIIDPSAELCTAMLVDRHLGGRFPVWAVAAAFGDDLPREARALATPLGLSSARIEKLREIGEALSYNGYGDSEADLIVHPTALYRTLHRYVDPFAFAREPLFRTISEQRRADLAFARAVEPQVTLAAAQVYILPDTPWSRRVRGAFANEVTDRAPDIAHAVLTRNLAGGYTVSVRAPANSRSGADALCRRFATGSGRAGAAGINHLPEDRIPEFVRQFDQAFPPK